MRERNATINVRVTDLEKRKMEKSARKCGLSLSAFLRKTALGKEVSATTPPQIYEAYRHLKYIRENSTGRLAEELDQIIRLILEANSGVQKPTLEPKDPWQ